MEIQNLQTGALKKQINDYPKNNRFSIESLKIFASDIKLTHSIFALPFVVVALSITGWSTLSWIQVLLILLCMVSARSFAMGVNRFWDQHLDHQNPRTAGRALPSGRVSATAYSYIIVTFGILFVVSACLLSRLAGQLSPVLLMVLAGYTKMKKISWFTHWYLGVCLGLAPVAAQVALFGTCTWPVIFVGLAVAFWTAGFDLLYSLQDKDFDTKEGLYSVPAIFGHKTAIWLSRWSFLIMIGLLTTVGLQIHGSWWWYIGVLTIALILTLEHWIIRDAMVDGESSKINLAFFNLNALVSVLFSLFAIANAYAQ